MDAADPTPARTLAVVLGASWLPRAPDLAQGAAYSRSAQQLLDYLLSPTGLALPRDNINYLFDDNRSAGDQLGDLSDFLERRCRDIAARGAPAADLLIFYVGNGLFCGPERAFHLAIRVTDPERDSFTSLSAGQLAQTIGIGAASGLRKFLVLDCTFPASAYQELPASPMERGRQKILDRLPPRGVAMLCATTFHDPGRPPQDVGCTPFTASLLESLQQGQADLAPQLSLSEVGLLLKEHLRKSLPQEATRPTVHAPDRREGHIAHIGIFPNPAYQERQVDERPVVMVVDDSSVVRTVTQRLLERHGMRVLAANDGMAAVELLQSHVPEVILLDIEMPRMDGFAVATHVRKDPRTRDVPIVMITASEGTRNRARAFDIGVDDYLSKPYREAQLMSVIRPLIGQARARAAAAALPNARETPPAPASPITPAPAPPAPAPAPPKEAPTAASAPVLSVVPKPAPMPAPAPPPKAEEPPPVPASSPASEPVVVTPPPATPGARAWAVGDSGRVIEMLEGGKTWTSRRSATQRELSSVCFCPDGLHGWAVGFSGTVIATRDGGRSWLRQRSQTRENLNSVCFMADARRGWAVGAVGEIVATQDGGHEWERQESDTTHALSCVHFGSDGRHGWAVGGDGTVIATRNGGRIWVPQSTPTKKKLFSVCFLNDSRRGWAVGHRGVVLATDDGGEIWTEQNSRTEMHLYSVFFADGRHGWAVGRHGVVIATDNGGRTWLEQDSRTESTLSCVYFAADSRHGWAVGFNGTVVATSDGGRSWKEQHGPVDMTLNSVCFQPAL